MAPYGDHGSTSFSTSGKASATAHSWSAASQSLAYPLKKSRRRPPLSETTFTEPEAPPPNASHLLGSVQMPAGPLHHPDRSSMTWTTSSSDLALLSGRDEVDDREPFVQEYNRLAKRYGVRLLMPGDFLPTARDASMSLPNRKGSWLARVLHQTSSGQPSQAIASKSDLRHLRHRRSISDVALHLVHHPNKEGLRGEGLPDLVRLCGKSLLYLPTEYAPCSLVLPTCFRALAQALVQQAGSRGIFRVPGSVRVVNALYDYYCADRDDQDISSTTRCPKLPSHIKCGVHDVASAFKKFLAGLPGGILGSLALFDALVAMHSQLQLDPELNKTKETRLRARLIALAIGSVKSQYQRELICAVFGLLSLVGRAAETAAREDEDGRPLPTGDLMGYNALGIVFGPLLVGKLIDSYTMKVADPSSGLVLLPVTPPRSRKERHRRGKPQRQQDIPTSFNVDKIHVANSITEMVITHWREVVRHMRNLGSVKAKRPLDSLGQGSHRSTTSSSTSDLLSLSIRPGWDNRRPVSSCVVYE
ncbi:hypothetical protein GGR56DRAFT_667959 [Xylariaceae sp. FL0804]|nr:hypothetical protein GGR56DRAFT_667959 [Xylariaceae sp. FL0804]